jgi:hypothetical protein
MGGGSEDFGMYSRACRLTSVILFDIIFGNKFIESNGPECTSEAPVSRDPGRDETPPGTPAGSGERPELGSPHWRLVPCRPDWLDDEAYAHDDYPGDLEEYEDLDNAPPRGLDDREPAILLARAREVSAADARAEAMRAALGHTAVVAAVESVAAGRRGPGMPGSAEALPGSPPARRPGSRRACRWMSCRAVPPWPRSWRVRPTLMTGTPGRPTTS